MLYGLAIKVNLEEYLKNMPEKRRRRLNERSLEQDDTPFTFPRGNIQVFLKCNALTPPEFYAVTGNDFKIDN